MQNNLTCIVQIVDKLGRPAEAFINKIANKGIKEKVADGGPKKLAVSQDELPGDDHARDLLNKL